jgi:hypothetical protein
VFLVLAYTVLMLAAEHLPPNYAAAASFLVPLIGFAAVAWAFVTGAEAPIGAGRAGGGRRSLKRRSRRAALHAAHCCDC